MGFMGVKGWLLWVRQKIVSEWNLTGISCELVMGNLSEFLIGPHKIVKAGS